MPCHLQEVSSSKKKEDKVTGQLLSMVFLRLVPKNFIA